MQLMRDVQFDSAFMFIYSEREGTYAARRKPDTIPLDVKKARLQALIAQQEAISKVRYSAQIGKRVEVLIQGPGRRDPTQLVGRTSDFKTTILPGGIGEAGDLVQVEIVGATSHTLFGEAR